MSNKKGSFLKSRTFILNIFLLISGMIACFFILSAWLSSFTHHGENIDVPDLRGKKISNLNSILSIHNFHYKVIDSLFDSDKIPGTVLDQDPAPKSKVKENRTIYLTINAIQPPDVKMPDLIDVSFRQAEAMLESFGLVMGSVSYRTDLAKNAVLEQRYNNRVIKPGAMLPKGSTIDLVLGDGLNSIDIPIPDLTGMTKKEAASALQRLSLALGTVQFADEKDSLEARVYKQSPSPDDGSILKSGDGVDISLR